MGLCVITRRKATFTQFWVIYLVWEALTYTVAFKGAILYDYVEHGFEKVPTEDNFE